MAYQQADHSAAYPNSPDVFAPRHPALIMGGRQPAVHDRQTAEDLDCRMAELAQILSRHLSIDITTPPEPPSGIIILDHLHRVLDCNAAASFLLRSGDSPLQLIHRQLVAIGSPATRMRLHRLLTDADGLMGVFSIGMSRWLGIWARRQGHENTIRVTLRNIALPAGPRIEARLTQTFDLTRAEARLASALVAGQSLQEAALTCGTRIGTARNYLNRVFRKTATNRQSQLVALICRVIAESPP